MSTIRDNAAESPVNCDQKIDLKRIVEIGD
jgi:hypothetical protein